MKWLGFLLIIGAVLVASENPEGNFFFCYLMPLQLFYLIITKWTDTRLIKHHINERKRNVSLFSGIVPIKKSCN